MVIPDSFVSYFLSPVNNVEGGYRNSQRLSVRPSFSPSVQKESPLTATIFHWSLPNFYTMFISMKKFIICSFIKKCQKLLPWQPFFHLSGISAFVSSLHESIKVPSSQTFTTSITATLFHIFLLKLVCMLGFMQRIFLS